MRRADRKRPSKSVARSSNGPAVTYTAGQHEQLQHGLRILSRMIARAHLRQEASRSVSTSSETPLEGKTRR